MSIEEFKFNFMAGLNSCEIQLSRDDYAKILDMVVEECQKRRNQIALPDDNQG